MRLKSKPSICVEHNKLDLFRNKLEFYDWCLFCVLISIKENLLWSNWFGRHVYVSWFKLRNSKFVQFLHRWASENQYKIYQAEINVGCERFWLDCETEIFLSRKGKWENTLHCERFCFLIAILWFRLTVGNFIVFINNNDILKINKEQLI